MAGDVLTATMTNSGTVPPFNLAVDFGSKNLCRYPFAEIKFSLNGLSDSGLQPFSLDYNEVQ